MQRPDPPEATSEPGRETHAERLDRELDQLLGELRVALPGMALTTVGLVLVTLGFRVYVHFAGDMRAIYGALGGIVLSMIATWIIVYVILLGGVLNASLSQRRLHPGASSGGA